MNGKIESITTDWRGDTLALGVGVSQWEFAVNDIADFDEEGGWLTIADSAPLEYISTDDAAVPVVTLADPLGVGVSFEAGDPVNVWDPTVKPAGAKVVEYVASVMTDHGAVPAVIPHAVVPVSGVDHLIGASVALDEEDDGDWYISQVFARETSIDVGYLGSPLFRAHLAVDGGKSGGVSIPTGADTTVDDWVLGTTLDPDEFSFDPATGKLTLMQAGSYLSVVTTKWIANTSGRREVQMIATFGGVDSNELQIPFKPDPDAGTAAMQAVLPLVTTQPETELRVRVFQNTGAALGLDGSTDGRLTNWRVVRLR